MPGQDEFDAFFRAGFPSLVAFLRKSGADAETASDAAAEAMLYALECWTAVEEPHAWVRQAAARLLDAPETRPGRAVTGEGDHGSTPAQATQTAQTPQAAQAAGHSALLDLLDTLPGRQRAVVVWSLDGFTPAQIGTALQVAPATVRSTLRHVRERLRTSRTPAGQGKVSRMPATEYGDPAVTELLREPDAALRDSLHRGLDVEDALLRVRGRALVREIAAAPPAAEFPDQWRRHDEPVADAIAGDEAAAARLLATIRPLVVRYCRARLGRQERSFASADDVAQEVCLAVLTALPSYRDQGRPFLAFVYGIAQHKVADAHRAAARNRTDPVPEIPDDVLDTAGPEQRLLRHELNEQLTHLLAVLPPKQREIVVLRVVVGLSAEETAGAVGSTPGAVRVAQHRALARLRRLLTGYESG